MLLAHVVIARLCRRAPPQLAAAGGALAGSVPTMLLVRLLVARTLGPVPSAIDVTYGALVYACLAYSYFHVFNMSETARRIRILSELYLAGPLSGREISRLYSGEGLLEARLDRLVGTRLLALRGGRYVRVARPFYAAAWLIRGWRTVLGFDRGRLSGSGA
jgi:hypothetical protein